MKALFLNIPASGHINPTLPVISALLQRGEEVICVNAENQRAAHEKLGARFVAYPDSPELQRRTTQASGANFAVAALAFLQIAEILLPDLIALIEHERPDYLIYDSLACWGPMLARRFHLPTVASVTMFVINRQTMPRLPSPHFARTLLGMLRRAPQYRRINLSLRQRYAVVAPTPPDALMNLGQLNIVFTLRALQPKAETLGDNFVFVGPSFGQRPHDPDFPFDQMRRPALYIALGTIDNNHPDFYRACFAAFADFSGTVVLAAGKNTDIAALGTPPPNFIVRPFVPQLEVLQHVDAFITHAGMNSVHEALYYGVPLLVLPRHGEQDVVARQVVARGAGLSLDHRRVNAETLRTRTARLLAAPGYKTQAAQLGAALRNGGGAAQAAEAIIQFTRRPS
ncbi:MAG: glycosyl transferase [Chloroflexi bacterium]|nr:glycosyl transferase [Chloroflexota bacterium]